MPPAGVWRATPSSAPDEHGPPRRFAVAWADGSHRATVLHDASAGALLCLACCGGTRAAPPECVHLRAVRRWLVVRAPQFPRAQRAAPVVRAAATGAPRPMLRGAALKRRLRHLTDAMEGAVLAVLPVAGGVLTLSTGPGQRPPTWVWRDRANTVHATGRITPLDGSWGVSEMTGGPDAALVDAIVAAWPSRADAPPPAIAALLAQVMGA